MANEIRLEICNHSTIVVNLYTLKLVKSSILMLQGKYAYMYLL